MKIPRLYYTLPELAEEWKLPEDALLHMAAGGKLELSAYYAGEGRGASGVMKIFGDVQIFPEDAEEILRNGIGKYREVFRVKWKGEKIFLKPLILPITPDTLTDPPVILYNMSDLHILPDEAARVDAIYGLSNQIPQQSSFVDDDHWITGEEPLCKAFGLKATSMTSVRAKVKASEFEFDYDPKTKEKRLRASTIVIIKAGA